MMRKLYYKNDRWCVATELDSPTASVHYDDSLPTLGRWMIQEIRDWVRRRI